MKKKALATDINVGNKAAGHGSNVPMQPNIPPMPSNTSNALKALNSVNATQSNALDSISRAKAIDEIKEIYEWHDNVTKERIIEHFKQLPPANNSEIPNSSDTISRQAAIEALKNDMASLDHIIKGMSANDVRLDAYVSQRNQVNYDIYTINNLPPVQPAQLGTNLAEVGTDCISRAKAIEALDKRFDSIPMEQTSEILMLRKDLRELPPAQPLNQDSIETQSSDPSQIAAQIIHDAIDNTTFAEEAYPGIKEQMHRSVEEWEKLQPVFTEIAEEYKKACEISYINKPLAYALHEVWKKHDRRDTKRNE